MNLIDVLARQNFRYFQNGYEVVVDMSHSCDECRVDGKSDFRRGFDGRLFDSQDFMNRVGEDTHRELFFVLVFLEWNLDDDDCGFCRRFRVAEVEFFP